MALKRVTIQDIANACGFSRNTVSKVFNNRGSVPEATRKTILQKARELGYYQLPGNDAETESAPKGNIALLTGSHSLTHAFGVAFLRGFTNQMSRRGYNLKIYEVCESELENLLLPPHLSLAEVSGILSIELFNRTYLNMLSSLGIPMISIDCFSDAWTAILPFDVISMENYSSMTALMDHLIDAGAKRIGFVGDVNHCLSIEDRWFGYCAALSRRGLTRMDEYSILKDDCEKYGDPEWMLSQLDKMSALPDAFVCANDYIAISLIAALKQKGLSIPQDVMVTGFDDSPEASVVEPALTTVRIPGADIGRIAADMLLNQIPNPGRPFIRSYVKTTPVFRGSTR
ncbi:MAG: LacI family DNA-binding transcriptional regulator [Lachnospiraceae bacterium]|nr:LacI family DNA-binding transcriptional regulator [Lachnospiraceae bacterium]